MRAPVSSSIVQQCARRQWFWPCPNGWKRHHNAVLLCILYHERTWPSLYFQCSICLRPSIHLPFLMGFLLYIKRNSFKNQLILLRKSVHCLWYNWISPYPFAPSVLYVSLMFMGVFSPTFLFLCSQLYKFCMTSGIVSFLERSFTTWEFSLTYIFFSIFMVLTF